MDIINVVCGIIFKENKVFICKRKNNKPLAGYWEFPGGKVELNEDLKMSLLRELNEELEMEVTIEGHYLTTTHNYSDFTIKLIAFKCFIVGNHFVLNDHDQYKWVNIEELSNYKLAPADVPIATSLALDINSSI
jgi:8-oxo-dGTP diphosphatase